ncbi:MAG: hypothetical protein HW388_581 [Dehalococcoidia bacterium]|nr:hypothetical protein [Dehalococcoidia bacterium]
MQRAMRDRNELSRSVLRIVRSEIHNEEIAHQRPLDEEGIVGVISKQVRQHRESIDAFRKGQREDLVRREELELAVLLDYLPAQMSREEIATLAQKSIQEVGAKGPADRGKVMGKLMPQVRGKAEGAMVNDVVSQLLEAL